MSLNPFTWRRKRKLDLGYGKIRVPEGSIKLIAAIEQEAIQDKELHKQGLLKEKRLIESAERVKRELSDLYELVLLEQTNANQKKQQRLAKKARNNMWRLEHEVSALKGMIAQLKEKEAEGYAHTIQLESWVTTAKDMVQQIKDNLERRVP